MYVSANQKAVSLNLHRYLVEVKPTAKYVLFETFDDPSVSKFQRAYPAPRFPWPYTEAVTVAGLYKSLNPKP
jgi:DMSO/TMAO reductase YedYZ molybdopterin-dependent catalytic subunit